MAYRFCLGASGAGKSTYLHRFLLEGAAESMRDLDSARPGFFLIVPEQYSMQTQLDLVRESANKGIMNVDVLSFGRLSHRVFAEAGEDRRAVLNDVGKGLVLRRIAGRCEKDLQILGGSIHRHGMISEVKSVVSEFMQYGIGVEQVEAMRTEAQRAGKGALAARLHDIGLLMEAFIKEEEKQFITSEQRLGLLSETIPHSAFLKDSVIVLDGFTGFTPVQLKVLAALIRTARDVVISLDFGTDGGPSPSWVEDRGNAGREQALFYLTRKTIRDLHAIAVKEGLQRGKDLYIGAGGAPADSYAAGAPAVRYAGNAPLAHLEKHLFRYPLVPYNGSGKESVSIRAAADPAGEVRQICIAIRRLVTEKGYRYKDIAVVTGDLQTYGELLERQGSRFGIPVYLDRTSTIGLNPLTEAIRSALDIPSSGYSYEAFFRYLRSGMSEITQEEADVLENFCIEHGIRGKKKWLMPFDDVCEPLRKRLLEELAPLLGTEEALGKRAAVKTAAERTAALYRFMAGCRMEEKTKKLADAFREEGDAVREKQYSQLYRAVIELLEQIWLLLSDEKISAEDYRDILDAGLNEIRLGTLPAQADRLLVGDIERTRLPEVKVLFFAGVCDGSIPRSVSSGGLLSDLDREFLAGAGVELSPAPREQMYLQRLYLYINMTKPTDRLILSYADKSADGKSLRPSYLIHMVSGMFPGLEVEYPDLRPVSEQLTGSRDAQAWLAGQLRELADGYYKAGSKEEEQVRTVYGFLMRRGEDTAALRRLKNAAFLRYDPARIGPETAQGLYGRSIAGSISRMEMAAQCRLRHFLRYGLRLAERKTFDFEAVDAGTILHKSVEIFGNRLAERGTSWRGFSPEEGRALAEEVLRETAVAYHDLILYDTARSAYRLRRLQRILERTVETLQYQLRKGSFEPAGEEISFGGQGGLVFPLSGGRRLQLIGRIDRMDLARKDDTLYVKILDYKSGMHQLEPERIEIGLQLQLILYMNAALKVLRTQNPELKVVPAAMLYYRMTDPVQRDVISADRMIEGMRTGEAEEDIEKKIRRALRPTGLVSSDREALDLLDGGLTGTSDVIPAGFTRSGDFTAASRIYTSGEFQDMSEKVRGVLCLLAEEILAGSAEANPVRDSKEGTACGYCPYKDVCGFDVRIPGYGFRDI